jgi:hypothetical protein
MLCTSSSYCYIICCDLQLNTDSDHNQLITSCDLYCNNNTCYDLIVIFYILFTYKHFTFTSYSSDFQFICFININMDSPSLSINICHNVNIVFCKWLCSNIFRMYLSVLFFTWYLLIRIRKSKKNRQRNGQKKKNKSTNNDL